MSSNNEQLKTVENYLRGKVGDQIKDKIMEKVAKKLGAESVLNLLAGNFPAAKLASFATNILWGLWFEGFYIANGAFQANPYDPSNPDQQDQYAEYLIYSWARSEVDKKTNPGTRGGPGYIYMLK